RERAASCLASACVPPYPTKCFHVRRCQPGPPSRGIRPERAALRPKACATERNRPPLPTTAQTTRPRAPSARLCPAATRCCESGCPAECFESAKYFPAEYLHLLRSQLSGQLPGPPER